MVLTVYNRITWGKKKICPSANLSTTNAKYEYTGLILKPVCHNWIFCSLFRELYVDIELNSYGSEHLLLYILTESSLPEISLCLVIYNFLFSIVIPDYKTIC
jgi:hypothetical protein